MGGNAMKHVGVTRQSAADYAAITAAAIDTLRALFPAIRCQPILAYGRKETFGDSDILIESTHLPPDWIEQVKAVFAPQDLIVNGDVVSFDFRAMQIDLITTPADEMEFAASYYAFNDLGNLMGRIAHKMGLKYGHDGLWKLLRDNDQVFAEILITRDVARTFALLGYDHARYLQGFETLDDVFEFAASTPYFHRQIYLLDNRNAASRVRDAKRPSYTAFLAWIADKPELDRYTWSAWDGGRSSPERDAERADWERRIFNDIFLEARPRYLKAIDEHDTHKRAKLVWNGTLVAAHTGYQGRELGEFMAACRANFMDAPHDAALSFEQWVLTLAPDGVIDQVRAFQKVWS
ncbi:hypothetical protein BN2497_9735 [Janthinobacterium sp. CG23_2]|nr:hypothetical protein [Massilia sp. H27-R4]CUI07479.1 hypothetical protein BN2497_9735 [Janthinobacterium sp. CG23_2]CUU31265.1 hypothetical protein BN3177_9735 [Janthinobacterium sp. CG23_2]